MRSTGFGVDGMLFAVSLDSTHVDSQYGDIAGLCCGKVLPLGALLSEQSTISDVINYEEKQLRGIRRSCRIFR